MARPEFRSALQAVFLIFVAITVLSYGSVGVVPLRVNAIVFAVLSILSAFYPHANPAVERVRTMAIVLITLLLLYVVLQATPLPGHVFANPAWKDVEDLVGPAQGVISVAPAATMEALPGLALPFLVFVSGLALFQGDADGFFLWRCLAYFGVAMAIFGLVQFLFFPDTLLLDKKKYYLESLTGSFVNRNTAGTFFGLCLLLSIGLLFRSLRDITLSGLLKTITSFECRIFDKHTLSVLHALACLIVAVALFLTQSRGAVGATFVAVVFAVAFMAMRRLTADRADLVPERWRTWIAIAGGMVLVVGLFAVFAGKSVYRMQEQGTDDARWCAFAATFQAIQDNWIVGTGYGTFTDTFPAYRNSGCTGIFGVWDHAHNGYLEGYLGMGIPFALAVVAVCAVLTGVFGVGLRDRRQMRFAPVMALAALVLVALHALVDFSLQIPGCAVFFAAVMASGVTLSLGRARR